MNTGAYEKKLGHNGGIDQQRNELVQNLVDLLNYELIAQKDTETPIPPDVLLEIESTFLEEDAGENTHDEPEQTHPSPSSIREFRSVDDAKEFVKIVVNQTAEISPGFLASQDVVVGAKTVIGVGCSSKSPIGKKVTIGDNTNIGIGGMVGSFDLGRWKNKPLQIGKGVNIGDGVKIGPNTNIQDGVWIGPRAKISYVKHNKKPNLKVPTIIGEGVVIGDGAVVESGVQIGCGYKIMPNTHLPKGLVLPDNFGEPKEVDANFIKTFLWIQRKQAKEADTC